MTDPATLEQPRATDPEPFRWAPMLLLAFAVFTTVTVEMVPAGLVPAISADFDVRISTVGLLLSVWAVTIAVASLPLVRLLGRVDRRTVLVAALVVMAVANVVLAGAPAFEVAVAARIVAAAAHGVFWSIVMVYASSIAPPAHMGRAVAIAGAGGTGAVLAGVPLGTAVGQFADWRVVFAGLALLMLGAAAVIRFALPSVPAPTRPERGAVGGRDRTLGAVLLVGFVQLLVALAQFTLYTYVSPFLTDRVGLPADLVSVLLLVFGVGGLAGLVVVGFTADRAPRASLAVALAVFAGALLTLAATPDAVVVVVLAFVLWGIAIGALPPLLLARTLRVASERTRALASALAVVSFNLGIGGGAWIGGLLVDGPGLGVLAGSAGAAAAASLVVAVLSFRMERRQAASAKV